MKIANISHNDDLLAVIRKCNANFKELSFSMRQAAKKQSRMDSEEAIAAINQVRQDMVDTVIPQQVAAQIAALDLPTMVSEEVARQLVVPPIGSYLLMQSDPSAMYADTTWQQNDTVGTTGGAQIPLWERIA